MDKILPAHNALKKWKAYNSVSKERRNRGEKGANVTEVLANASNVTIRDSAQINVVGGDVTNNMVTNITNVINNDSTDVDIHEALRRLADPMGCFWNASATCLAGTRETHIGEIISWINGPVGSTAEIYVVADSAGSGKSALAHTICRKAEKEKTLVVGFFFNQMNQHSTSSGLMASFIRGLCDIDNQIKRQVGETLAKNNTLAIADPVRQFEDVVLPICPLIPQNRHFVIVIDALDEEHDPIILSILRDWVPRLPPCFRVILTTRPEERIVKALENQPHISHSSRSLTGAFNDKDIRTFITFRLSKTTYGPSITPEVLTAFIKKTEGLFLWAATVLNHIDDSYDPAAELEDIVTGDSTHWDEDDAATQQLDSLYLRILSKHKWTDRRFVEKYKKIMGAFATLKEPLSPTALAALYAPEGIKINDVHRICSLLRPLLQDYSASNPRQPVRLLHLSVQEFLTKRAPLQFRLNSEEHHSRLSHLALLVIKNGLTSTNVPILEYSLGEWTSDPLAIPPKVPSLEKDSVSEQLWYSCHQLEHHTSTMPTEPVEKSHIQLAREVIVEQPRAILEVTAAAGAIIDIISLRKLTLVLSSSTLDAPTTRTTARIYCSMARILAETNRHTESRPLARDSVDLYRQVSSETDPDVKKEFALALVTLSATLYSLKDYEVCRQSVREGLGLLPPLDDTDTSFRKLLSRFLRIDSLALSGLEHHDEAIRIATEAITISRQLVTDRVNKSEHAVARALSNLAFILNASKRVEDAIPPIVECIDILRAFPPTDLSTSQLFASSFHNYSFYLSRTGKFPAALPAIQDAIGIYHTLYDSDPARFRPNLVAGFQQYGWCLSQTGSLSEAVEQYSKAIAIQRELAAKDPATHEPRLSDLTYSHAHCLSGLGNHVAAVQVGQEALQIRRRIAVQDPIKFEPSLGFSLWKVACDLDECQRTGDATPLLVESIDLRRRLAAGDAEHVISLAHSLHSYGYNLSRAGKNLEAIEPTTEAVTLRRELASKDPGVSEPMLAYSLHNLGCHLTACDRHSDALPCRKEVVEIRRRLASRDPATYDVQLADSLDTLTYTLAILVDERDSAKLQDADDPDSEAVVARSDDVIALRIEAVGVRRRLATGDSEQSLSDVARTLFSLAADYRVVKRYTDAIPAMQESIEIRRRLLARDPKSLEQASQLASCLMNYPMYLAAVNKHTDATESAQESVDIYRSLAAQNPDLYNESLAISTELLALYLDKDQRHDDAIAMGLEAVTLRRQLAAGDPSDSEAQSSLAEALYDYASYLFDGGRHADTLDPIRESVAIRRRIAGQSPEQYTGDLGDSLNCHAWYLAETGPYPEAVQHAEEAVALFRSLSTSDAAHIGDLENALDTLAHALNLCERYEEALSKAKEGLLLEIEKEEEEEEGSEDGSDLQVLDGKSTLHQRCAVAFFHLGRKEDALEHVQLAIPMFRMLVAHVPERKENLEQCLRLLDQINNM
ncbi:TPR-like protein [Coprinopsis marcescibilis]|uniref:TPR-like protein n=1 Tax=Coprinopsis marcescibilis TaxID=230819 RepID=A0A5C3LL99_COPMA|nr:TPR-like protein [Coprinopsis marcescibilis]